MRQVTFALLAAMVAVFSSLPTQTGASHSCQEAREPDLSKLGRADTLHDSFYNMDSLTKNVKTIHNVPAHFVNQQRHFLNGPRQCPSWQKGEYGGTLCPSYSVLNYDENRVPATMVEARCSCSSCLTHPDDNGVTTLVCQPVVYHTWVFRRVGCSNGQYQYEQVLEPLTVACSCGVPKVRVAAPRTPPPRPIPVGRRRRRVMNVLRK